MKPYKHINKRIENTSSGCLGTLVEASRKEGANVWDVGIKWDCEEGIDRHFDTANLWKYNRIVPDDYAPDHGPISERINAIIFRLKNGTLPYLRLEPRRGRWLTTTQCANARAVGSKEWLAMKPKQYFISTIKHGLVVVLSKTTEDRDEAQTLWSEISREHPDCVICETIYG